MSPKVLFPRNIKKGFFSSMMFTVGPLTVTIIQLFILVIGIASSFAVANSLIKHGNHKFIAIAAASPLALISVAIAFFNVSEMGLLEFLAKMLRTHFFDTTTKYQVNVENYDSTELLIQKNHSQEQTQKIIFKTHKDLEFDDVHASIEKNNLL